MIKRSIFVFLFFLILFLFSSCVLVIQIGDEKVGWAIGWDEYNSAAIVHTRDGGKTWEVQGDPSLWEGLPGNDITAADEWTAWAALGDDGEGTGGMIINTVDGGETWEIQDLPAGVAATDSVKSIKAINCDIVWAVTLHGTVLRTANGGQDWEVMEHPGIDIVQVNRMDAKGSDVWIADVGSRDRGMVHISNFGQGWRKEFLPDLGDDPGAGPMAVSIVDSQTVWACVRPMADVYRTTDGGTTWNKDAPEIAAENDLDDLCAPSAEKAWAVQNIGGFSGGLILKIEKDDDTFKGSVADRNINYQYEGISCYDNEIWAVGFKSFAAPADLPQGIIRHSKDGVNWETQEMPADNIGLWKVSFVGAYR